MKRTDLLILPWLNPKQALMLLADLCGIEMEYQDLVSHCQHGNCEVYIHPGEIEGVSSTALPAGENDWTATCYAGDFQKLLNPEALLHAAPVVTLHLQGTVRTSDFNDEQRRFESIEWEVKAELPKCSVSFKTTSVQALADLISKSAKPLGPKERNNLLRIIAVLAGMNGIDLKKPFKAYNMLAAGALASHLDLGMSDDTLSKYLKEAAQVPNKGS